MTPSGVRAVVGRSRSPKIGSTATAVKLALAVMMTPIFMTIPGVTTTPDMITRKDTNMDTNTDDNGISFDECLTTWKITVVPPCDCPSCKAGKRWFFCTGDRQVVALILDTAAEIGAVEAADVA